MPTPLRALTDLSFATPRPYAEAAKRLVGMFRENFAKFESHVDEEVRGAGPAPRINIGFWRMWLLSWSWSSQRCRAQYIAPYGPACEMRSCGLRTPDC